MRDCWGMTRIGLCAVLATIMLASCPSEQGSLQRSGPAASDQERAPAPDSGVSPTQVLGPGGQSSSGGEVKVGMTNGLRYAPEEVTITTGQTVVWTNTSSVVHTVTADPALAKDPSHVQLPEGAQPFNSGNMAPGAMFRHTFDVPGGYVYFCIPHETAGMIGRVNVQEK